MRHLCEVTLIEVALLAGGVIAPAGLGLLVAPASGALALTLPDPATAGTAVDLAIIAIAAEEEDLATITAGHEAQRLHDDPGGQKLDAGLEPCDETPRLSPRLSGVRPRRPEWLLGPSPFLAAPAV